MDDKKHFSSFDKNNLNFSPSNRRRPSLSPVERRSLILTDDTAIDCLFKLYQFYEIHSEPVSGAVRSFACTPRLVSLA